MKISLLRTTVVAALLITSASSSFAGPGIQYWNTRRDARLAEKSAVTAPSDAKCATMIVNPGKRASGVSCANDTAPCKACCSH